MEAREALQRTRGKGPGRARRTGLHGPALALRGFPDERLRRTQRPTAGGQESAGAVRLAEGGGPHCGLSVVFEGLGHTARAVLNGAGPGGLGFDSEGPYDVGRLVHPHALTVRGRPPFGARAPSHAF